MLNLIIRYLIGYPKKNKISKNYGNKCKCYKCKCYKCKCNKLNEVKNCNIEILPYFFME